MHERQHSAVSVRFQVEGESLAAPLPGQAARSLEAQYFTGLLHGLEALADLLEVHRPDEPGSQLVVRAYCAPDALNRVGKAAGEAQRRPTIDFGQGAFGHGLSSMCCSRASSRSVQYLRYGSSQASTSASGAARRA